MNQDLRKQLGQALGGIDALKADLVQRDGTDILELPTTFLNACKLYRVKYFGPSKPIVFYVGAALPERVFVTTGNPEAFVDMACEDGVVISSAAEATEYVTAFLKATRPMTRLFYFLNAVEDIQFLPKLTGDAPARVEILKEKYAETIASPNAAVDGEGNFRVSLFAMIERDLVRIDSVVDSAGRIEVDGIKLEEGLPVVCSV